MMVYETDEEALDALSAVADELDVPDHAVEPTNARLRELAQTVRAAMEAL